MPKRFTDSEKFRDKWYRNLKPKHKCLWEYLISECSIAGIIEFDYESASFHIGETITDEDLKIFNNKLVLLPDEKLFIPKFIKFQQGELNEKNPAHKNIIKELKKYGISETLDNIEFKSPFEAPSMVQDSTISNSNSNSNSKGISNSSKSYSENQKYFKNPDLMFDKRINKVFELYKEKCPNLCPLVFEERNLERRQQVKDLLVLCQYDMGYIEGLFNRANEQITFYDDKISFQSLIKNHEKIYQGLGAKKQEPKETVNSMDKMIEKWEREAQEREKREEESRVR